LEPNIIVDEDLIKQLESEAVALAILMNALKVHGSGLNKKPILPSAFKKKIPKRVSNDGLSVEGWLLLYAQQNPPVVLWESGPFP
jgi:hypothetical protein